MGRLLIIGAGGVGSVVAQKCARAREVFSDIVLASRTREKCDRIAALCGSPVLTAQVDADDPAQVAALIREHESDLVVNVALPYQDLSIMDACLEAGAHYLDTANYEPRDEAKFCYKWQWDYQDRFARQGLMALLGCGFDPGATNLFFAHLRKHHFDRIDFVDIMDCNAGDHGLPFATNFNPEINIREVTAPGRYWEDGRWIETPPLSLHQPWDFPEVGEREMYLMYHEEMESLAINIPEVKRMRFWMTFSENYLTHLRVLENVGMTRIDPVHYNGIDIIPLQFLKALLPDPSSLADGYKGKTNIGCMIEGVKDGKPRKYYIYNVCDHAECFREVGAQAISYTTGVPAMIGALMMLTGEWRGKGVFNVEEFDPAPFMERLNRHGLPWTETFPE
ncbi:MAG: saccharopine dehydrogenase family protein [Proteobacteria bacterium]|nr:saccharopine dehydrogenase family protein [Pseudomonadota bacterium]